MGYRIIDFHAHAFPDAIEERAVRSLADFYSLEMPCRGRIEDLLASAEASGVEKLVVHTTATKVGQVENINSWIASVMSEKVIGFGTLHPDYADVPAELDRMRSLGLRGIKLHPEFQTFYIDDEKMFPIYEAIGDRFPILFHMGDEVYDYSSPKRLAKVLGLFPELRVIGAHLGGYARWDEVKEYLVGKNLYFDTCSTLWRLSAEEATGIIRSHGVDRILFGTDYPITTHKAELERFMKLDLTEKERHMILGENARNLLELDEGM